MSMAREKLRPSSGSSLTCFASTVEPTVALVVCSSGGASVTVTCSAALCKFSETFSVLAWPDESEISVILSSRKPGARTISW
jgi:hypothetical protein